MAKPHLRIKARKLRRQGLSVNIIALNLGVSKSTISLWTRDIILSVSQLERLRKRSLSGAERGRLKSALKQKRARLELIERSNQEGIRYFKRVSSAERFVAGLALYWAEGTKKQRRISFCNSDPKMINFMIRWLKEHFQIDNSRLAAYVGINITHKDREAVVKEYWSKETTIPLDQFRKTSLKKTKNKKIYENHEQHFGTLTVWVLRPASLYYKMLGLIEGLSLAG